jgi:protein kinase X
MLGTGTFGRVVLARHRPSGEFYALKMMTISEVIRLKQVEHVKNEKEILSSVQHPFIVNMLWADHNDRFLYMLLEFICGGELFSYLRNAGRFSNSTSNFYAAEIVSALEYLHRMNIVYRDLKPENLLLDREGHLKLTDFGFAKTLLDRTWTLCGTPEYLAPEIIQSKGHNKAVDWWALGILIFEMLVGMPPFFDDNPFAIYQKILKGIIEWPRNLDHIAKDLTKKLLVLDRTKRLGNMKGGTDDIKKHKWFKHLRWDDVYNKKLPPPIIPRMRYRGDPRNFFPDETWGQPPIVPKVAHNGDSSCFDDYNEDDWHKAAIPSHEQLDLFGDF